jgi:ATP adenylyltransferase
MAGASGWDRLWTPHRIAYIKGENRPSHTDAGDDCPFCRVPALPDDEALIVHRGHTCFVVLNLYPYNPGHMLICPYRHIPDYTDLTVEETAEFAQMTQDAMRTMRAVASPQGFNVGMNQGSVGGAGIAGHLHQHVVPRWGGDTNFITVVGATKTMPALLEETRQLVADAWPA